MHTTLISSSLKRVLSPTTRSLHTSPRRRASILFALSALSNSRETQHFNKLTRLPRIEHSPPLKLIKTGEIDPFPLPTPIRAARLAAVPTLPAQESKLAWDERALQIGRVFLSDSARRTHRLQRALARAHKRETRRNVDIAKERVAWERERKRLRDELRVAGVWILASVGTVTGLAMWRFWPSKQDVTGDMGRGIAAQAAVERELARDAVPVAVVGVGGLDTAEAIVTAVPGAAKTTVPVPGIVQENAKQDGSSWWKGLFWRQ